MRRHLGKPEAEKSAPDGKAEEVKPVMKISEVINLKFDLEKFQKESGVKGWQIGIAVLDNLEDMKRSLAAIERYEKELMIPLEPFTKEKEELVTKHCSIDGMVQTEMVEGKMMTKIQDRVAYNLAFAALKEKHKDIVEEYDRKYDEHLKNIQEKDSTFKITYISRAVLEKEAPGIDQKYLSLIYPILEPRK
jgi:hypothetical protein